MTNRAHPGLIALCLAVSACGKPGDAGSGRRTNSQARHGSWGIETQFLSDSVRPGDNFYRYVNEGWLESTELPPGYSFYSEPWVVQDRVLDQVDTLITRAVKSEPQPGTADRRVRDLYLSFLDTATVEAQGLSLVEDDLSDILSLQTHEDVARRMAKPRSSSIFHLLVQPPVDMKGGYILTVAQYRTTGLGLPGQIYYKGTESPYTEHRAEYVTYIAETLSRAGLDRPEERARAVLSLETAYANVMWDLARLREAGAAFNLIPASGLDNLAPGFPWQDYLQARGVGGVEFVNVGVGALTESAALFRQYPVETWSSFLAFHWIDHHADLLPESFGTASFTFYNQGLYGVVERESREERATQFVQRHLGDDIGSLYLREHFPASRREAAEELVSYIRRAFRERLHETTWMDGETRDEAIRKLDAIIVEIGEPRSGIDWSDLETAPDDLLGNYGRLVDHRWAQEHKRIGAPIDRYGDWNMYPHRIGAGYHQQYNKIFVTAGALLPPFFDSNADPAVNFGSVGQTIAHEFGHALDDQGSKFDSNGALRDWWSDESRSAYRERTSALAEQFKMYSPVDGVYLAADQMVGEIVGDLAGASVAHRAYELYSDEQYNEGPPILDGFTGSQRFFLGAAQQARTIATESAMRDIALHESHPVAEFRINGIMTHLDAWYDAFEMGPDASYYRAVSDRIMLW